jgi:hypothetical protein
MALRPDWDPATLKPGYYLGYGVDGGSGCFVDEGAAACLPDDQPAYWEALRRPLDHPSEVYQQALANRSVALMQELAKQQTERSSQAYRAIVPPGLGEVLGSYLHPDKVCQPSWSAVLDPETGANIVCFHSGHGDGCYPSYFGLAADGSAACLVTDFGLLVRPVMGTLELSVPVQQHSELTHPRLAEVGTDRVQVNWNPATGNVDIILPGDTYVQDMRLENRPGVAARSIGFGSVGNDKVHVWGFRLDKPLQPTARVLIGYTLRTEVL